MNYRDLSILEYSKLLEQKSPTPGGGSVLSLVLELACDLGLMVCNFTIDKKGYENVQDEIKNIIERLKIIKDKAHYLIDEDSIAYKKVMDAYKTGDKNIISEASIYGCDVPYRLYKHAEECYDLCKRISAIGNKNLIADSDISVLLCEAIFNGCTSNIVSNANGILDEELKNKYLSIVDQK